MGPAADSIAQILENIDQNAEDFQQSTARTINLNNRSVQAAVDVVSESGIAMLAQADYGPELVKMMTTVGGHIRSANEAATQIEAVVTQLREQAARIRAGDIPLTEDAATATAIRNMNRNLIMIDEQIGKFAINSPRLVDASQKMIDKFLSGNEALNDVITSLLKNNFQLKESAEALGNLAIAVGRAYGFTLRNESGQPGATPSRPENQSVLELEARLDRVNSLLAGIERLQGTDAYNEVGNIRWSGLLGGWYDNNNASTPASWKLTYHCVANTTSKLYFTPAVRSSQGNEDWWRLNRTWNSNGQNSYERTCSLGYLFEIGT